MLASFAGGGLPRGLGAYERGQSLLDEDWLHSTRQLDVGTSSVRIQALKLTQLLADPRSRAMAIHDFVKSLTFAVVPDFLGLRASDILKLGHGDCHTKGMLFVALLRAAQVPARLRFVTLPTHFLHGLIDTGAASMTHAVAEVWLDGRWVQTDTYVMDVRLVRQARAMLMRSGRRCGFGVHRDAHLHWNGSQHAYAQYALADKEAVPLADLGATHDPHHFYADASHASLKFGFTGRVKWLLTAQIVNRKVELLRAGSLD